MANFDHIQIMKYDIQVCGKVTHKVAVFNCNKLPTGVAVQCIETDTYNPYLLTMTEDHFTALFLDDAPIQPESKKVEEEGEDGKDED